MKLTLYTTWRALRRTISFFVVLLLSLKVSAVAQHHPDSLNLTIYYPCGSSNLHKVSGNQTALRQFIQRLDSIQQQLPETRPVSLSVTSSTSPEGSVQMNRALSRQRLHALTAYLNRQSGSFRALTAAAERRTCVQTTNHKLGQIPLHEYPLMRYAQLTLYLYNKDKDSTSTTAPAEEALPQGDTIEVQPAAEATRELPLQPARRAAAARPLLMIKTNLPYDVATFINLSVEVPITSRLTAEATLVHPWWHSWKHHRTVQTRYVAVTPRYYLRHTAQPYTSFFAGISAGYGTYDLQLSRRGVQGTMWHISPVIGYSHHLGRRWKMEYSAAIGYVQTKYTKYTQTDDTPYGTIKVKDYPWASKLLRTVLPTSLNVSLVYTIGHTKTDTKP